MKITVIIPLYNKKAYIQRALTSVLSQTYADFEILVVNDGSTDGGEEIVRSLADRRIYLLTQFNAGPGAARNRGIAEARGEMLAFLDADDEWHPRFLERSLFLLDGYGPKVACISSGYWLWPSGHSTEPMWRRRGFTAGIHRLQPETSPLFAVHLLAYQHPCTTLARAEVVRRYGGFYSKGRCLYGEDSYFWLKVLLNEAVAVNLEPLTRLHQEASSLSRNLPGPRPVEPLLTDPAGLQSACPEHLRGLLERIIALRAMKTACVLSFWGLWREGRRLLKKFCSWPMGPWAFLALAQLCASPLGAAAGVFFRSLRK